MDQEQLVNAYYSGRNSVWFGFKCKYTDEAMKKAFYEGVRDAKAEDRLDRDTEWDAD